MAAFVGCCAQCTRRVSAKPKSLAGSHPIVVRGFNTRGQVTQHVSLPQQELRCVACSPGAEGRGWPRRPGVDLVEPSFDEPIAMDLFQPHNPSGSRRVIAMQRDPFSGAWINVDLRNIQGLTGTLHAMQMANSSLNADIQRASIERDTHSQD